MDQLTIFAPAKINLALKVKGKRSDGYHELEMIMQSVGLCDKITLKKIPGGIKLATSHSQLSNSKANLAYQAAELLLREKGINQGIEIFIEKNIPLAAGLAGGSSDAAAVLNGMDRLFALNLGYPDLLELAAELGSDVPFCLKGGTALALGRGDQLEQLPDLERKEVLLITPPLEISTAFIFQQYDLFEHNKEIPVKRLAELIKQKRPIKWNEGWGNDLEDITSRYIDDIKEIKGLLNKYQVSFAMMSGSGPTIFVIVNDYRQAELIQHHWPRQKDFVFSTSTLKADYVR
jgi:4-diphosphocytidyl-2-C-methyl-D-erythritol kinase